MWGNVQFNLWPQPFGFQRSQSRTVCGNRLQREIRVSSARHNEFPVVFRSAGHIGSLYQNGILLELNIL